MTRLTVITVTHDSNHLLDEFLERLGSSKEAKTLVVDSGSADVEVTRRIAGERRAKFIDAQANVGYGTGNNRGAAASQSEWLAFVNPDVEITVQSLLELVATAARNDLDAVAPSLEDLTGSPLRSTRPFMAPPWAPRSEARVEKGEVILTEVLSGCAFAIRRSAFERLGGFDESFFMFAEEYDLFKRLHDVGGTVGVVPAVVARTESGSSSSSTSRRWSSAERSVGHIRYVRRHHGRPAAYADLLLRCMEAFVRPELKPARTSLRQILSARPWR